jgi:tRNA threonylcarbamoyladenosine biosynthesis protein TsaB
VKALYLDISTQVMYVSYAENNQIIDVVIRIGNKDHAAHVIDTIDQLLKRNHQKIDDITSITVGKGPGSYTGIRMAVTVAKTLAYTKNIDLYEVSSLIFMTSGYKDLICAMIDARRQFVFYTIYDASHIHHRDQYRLLSDLSLEDLYKQATPIFIDENTYKVDIHVINNYRKIVKDIHGFEPNYTRKTEAEEHVR